MKVQSILLAAILLFSNHSLGQLQGQPAQQPFVMTNNVYDVSPYESALQSQRKDGTLCFIGKGNVSERKNNFSYFNGGTLTIIAIKENGDAHFRFDAHEANKHFEACPSGDYTVPANDLLPHLKRSYRSMGGTQGGLLIPGAPGYPYKPFYQGPLAPPGKNDSYNQYLNEPLSLPRLTDFQKMRSSESADHKQ